MPIHLEALDVVPEIERPGSALIVACNMCAGASLAMEENRPFLQFFRSRLKSPPLERHIRKLRSQLNGKGVSARAFKAGIVQQFFLCLWTRRQRSKFRACAKRYDAVIVLGCDSAIDTVRDSVGGTDCKVIKGAEVVGVMNTRPKFRWPGDISFASSKMVPMCDRHCMRGGPASGPGQEEHVGPGRQPGRGHRDERCGSQRGAVLGRHSADADRLGRRDPWARRGRAEGRQAARQVEDSVLARCSGEV